MRVKFETEYPLRTTAKVLYKRLSTASGLAEWFADNVKQDGDVFTFVWEGSEQKAKQIEKEKYEKVTFQWVEEQKEDTYFAFSLDTDEITNSLALVITDFAEEDEVDEEIELWDKQISVLKRKLGI